MIVFLLQKIKPFDCVVYDMRLGQPWAAFWAMYSFHR
jgi:hypothetical protein